jgi:cardiolipin synthase A/B
MGVALPITAQATERNNLHGPWPLSHGGCVAHRFSIAGNQLQFLAEGVERLDALVAVIDAARADLRLFYYSYLDDKVGQRVHTALLAAAERGVRIRLIIDAFGSGTSGGSPFFDVLRQAGIDLCVFHARFGRRYFLRNHQKFAVADTETVVLGGFNIAEDYFRTGPDGWRDIGLRLDGPMAAQLAAYFDVLHRWTASPRATIGGLRRALRRFDRPTGPIRWLFGGPARRQSSLARTLRVNLNRAKRLSIVAAYFTPNPRMLRRLDAIGQRGEARIVTASKSDNTTTIGAARWTYAGLLRKGVDVFEYQPMQLHTKLFVIDDMVYLGSANFDMRSLFLNMEIMLWVHDEAFADHANNYIDGEIAKSRQFSITDVTGWRRFPAKLRWALSYFLVAVLDYTVARRLNIDA